MTETKSIDLIAPSHGRARPTPEPEFAGRYRIMGWLASGGMGEVHVGHDPKLDRPVAIKRIRAELSGSEKRRSRLIQEARLGAQLSHPNVVQVYDLVSVDDVDYIVTEYVEGLSLREVAGGRPMGLGRTLEILAALLRGLGAAHAAGIVHRDLKSENVLIGDDGAIKIADFGIAREIQRGGPREAIPTAGARSGTYRSMSPEQTLGSDTDARTDFFSLGTLTYELLTGESPFAAESAEEMMRKIREAQHAPLTESAPGVPIELSRLIDRLLEKDPAMRPTHAGEVAEVVDRIARAHATAHRDSGTGEGVSRPVAAAFVRAHVVDAESGEAVGSLARWRRGVLETATRYRASVVSAFDSEVVMCVGFPRSAANNAEAAAHLLSEIAAISGSGVRAIAVSAAIDIGVATVVDPESSPYFVGAAFSLAAEIGRALEPGCIAASARAQARLADGFDLRVRTVSRVDGGTSVVYELGEMRDAVMEGPLPGSSHVGRDLELSRLGDMLAGGEHSAMLICGAPGIGKTRLVRELLAQTEAKSVRRLVARARETTQHTVLAPFASLIQTQIPELRGEEGAPTSESVAAAAAGLRMSEDIASALAVICGAEPPRTGIEGNKRGMAALVADGLAAVAMLRPTLLVFEDVHWSDRASVEVLESLADRARNIPLTLIATTRPGATLSESFARLELSPLAEADSALVIEEASRGHELAADLGRLIVARAEGLPLALEELTRAVVDRERAPVGLEHWVPATFSESVNERLDDLPTETGRLAVLAATVGVGVELPLLAAAAGVDATELRPHIGALVRHGLMRGGGGPDGRIAFRHALTRDVVVDRVLPTQRAQAHAAVVAGIESAFPAWLESRPEVIAHHKERAGDVRGAVAAWKNAGIRLARRWTFAGAQAHFEHAIALAQASDEPNWALDAELDVRRALSRVLMGTSGWGTDHVEANNKRMAELVDTTSGPPGFEDQYGAAAASYVKGDADRLSAQLGGLTHVAAAAPAEMRPLLEYLVGQMLGIYHFNAGPPSRARQELEKAVELRGVAAPILRETASGTQGLIAPRAYLAWCESLALRPDRALETQEEEEADHADEPVARAIALTFGCALALAGEQWDAARARIDPVLRVVDGEAGLPRAERRVIPQIEHTARMVKACLEMHDVVRDPGSERGVVERAARAMRRAYRGWQGGFMRTCAVQYLAMAADPCLRVARAPGLGDATRTAALRHARAFLSEGRVLVDEENPLDRYYASEVLRLDGDRKQLLGDATSAAQDYDEARRRAEAYAAGEPGAAALLFSRIDESLARRYPTGSGV